jgi:hypothetical protein
MPDQIVHRALPHYRYSPRTRRESRAPARCDSLGALLRRAARVDQVEGGVDEPDM